MAFSNFNAYIYRQRYLQWDREIPCSSVSGLLLVLKERFSNLSPEQTILSKVFCELPQSLKANAEKCYQNAWLFPLLSFPIYYSLIFIPLDAT